MTPSPVLRISNVRKSYQSLRPLRLRDLTIGAGERVSIGGLDAGGSEVLVNLVTGASLPDEGDVVVLGRSTRAIADGDEWLASLDRFGIVSPRAVLLDSASLLQNLVMPFTLAIDPPPPDVARRARALGVDVGIEERWLDGPVAALPPDMRVRAHLARAVALDPALLILEHPTAGLAAADHARLATDVARIASARNLATLIISEDPAFSKAAAGRCYTLHGATGELKLRRRGFFSF
jgi:ABC-type transporter Mla maintaining outer membrane lipid asymmetry ATPase subunit MlaF